MQRAAAFPGFQVHLAQPWLDASIEGGRIRGRTANGAHDVDVVIAGTGYEYDPHTRTELQAIAPEIALWRDVYQPPNDLTDDELGRWPYLGPGYEFVERRPGRAPWLGRIRVFSAAAALSFGIPVGDVASLATGIPRLVDAIGRDLFFEDQAQPVAGPTPPPRVSFRQHYAHAIRPAHADADAGLVDAGRR